MLDQLGVTWVDVDALQNLQPIKGVYACKIPPGAYLQRQDGGAYDRKDYYAHPEAYSSVFADKVSLPLHKVEKKLSSGGALCDDLDQWGWLAAWLPAPHE